MSLDPNKELMAFRFKLLSYFGIFAICMGFLNILAGGSTLSSCIAVVVGMALIAISKYFKKLLRNEA